MRLVETKFWGVRNNRYKYQPMKTSFTNLKNTVLVIGTFAFANICIAKTYVASSSGKWSSPSTWEGEQPSKFINSDDVVIIKNHVLAAEDISINGMLVIERNSSFISSKSVVVASNGQLINNGRMSVRRMMNEGKVENNGDFETMNEFQNNGNISNSQNVVVGTNMLNQGGRVEGQNGSYFANDELISSKDATYGDNVKIFYGTKAPVNTTSKDFNVEVTTSDNNVTLTVQNLSDKKVIRYEVTKSNDGDKFTSIANTQNTKADYLILQDNENTSAVVHYKVIAVTENGKINIPTTSVSLGTSTFTMK